MLDLTLRRRKLISAVPRMLYDGLGDEAGSARGMDVATFEDLIDRLGEDLSRWPDDQRLAAGDGDDDVGAEAAALAVVVAGG